MAMDINIRITVDTEGTYSAHEASILQALAGTATKHSGAGHAPAPAATKAAVASQELDPSEAPAGETTEESAAPAPEESAAPAPEAPKRTRRTKAQIAADKAAEAAAAAGDLAPSSGLGIFEDLGTPEEADPEQAEEAAEQAPAPAEERTVKEALDLATKFLTEGGAAGRAKVMAALEGTKASKVSELAGHDVTVFYNALSAEG